MCSIFDLIGLISLFSSFGIILSVFLIFSFYRNKRAVQFDKIVDMLNNDIDEMKHKLSILNALKNVDNNKWEIEYLECRIKHVKYLLDYLFYKR